MRIRKRGYGATLIEAMIASGLMVIISLGAITSIIVATRIGEGAQQDMMALELVNRQLELVKSRGDYEDLGWPGRTIPVYNADGTPKLDGDGDPILDPVGFTSTETIVYDPEFDENGPVFTVNYDWWGFGTVTSASSSALSFDSSHWMANPPSPVGGFVITRQGNQLAKITSFSSTSTSGSIGIDYALNDYSQSTWGTIPSPGESFEIDAGKHGRITIQWTTNSGQTRQIVRDFFVPWRSPTQP